MRTYGEPYLCTYWHNENRMQDIRVIRTQYYCEICQEITPHDTKNCPLNLKNVTTCWCEICAENTHDTNKCVINMKSKPNYHTMHQTSTVDQKKH